MEYEDFETKMREQERQLDEIERAHSTRVTLLICAATLAVLGYVLFVMAFGE